MPTGSVQRALLLGPEAIGPALIRLAEDQWFDRKSSRINAKDLADALVGFGNAEGGVIVVGLSDGRVEGTDRDPKLLNDQMQASLDHTVPPVRARSRLVPCIRTDGEGDRLLVIEIEPGEAVHANKRDVAYLRVGDETRRLSFALRQELTYDKGQGAYESRGSGLRADDLDDELVEQYAKAVGATDVERLLHARGLSVGDELTVAGCLLFARHPQLVMPEAFLRVLRYRGKERGTGSRQQLVHDQRLEGPLPHQILDARDLISEFEPKRRALAATGRFADVGLVPRDAWLEAVVNAAVHRSYSVGGDHTRIEIFDDRIEVTSPGRFPGIVETSRPDEALRYARNPRIARVLADMSYGQELGEGIKRMFEEMRLAGLQEPRYHQSSAAVHVELSGEPLDRKLDASLPDETREIVLALREADRLSTMEVARAIDLSRPATIKRLNALREAGVIAWVGKSAKDPRAYWSLPPT